LLAGGGELKVPCLRVEGVRGQVEWIYESSDIICYLEDKLVAPSTIVAD
jgi:glutathione S-transferase